MSDDFTYFDNLGDTTAIPADSILSRTLLNNDHVRLVLFHFAAGQELTEHTAARPAIIQILSGEARLTLGDEVKEASAGAWAYMRPQLTHAVYAKTALIMLLQLIK